MTDAFNHERRGSMSDQRRARIFLANGSKCHWVKGGKMQGCGRKIGAGDKWRVEHGDPLEGGGTDEDANLGVSCAWCWPAKDREDHKDAGHIRRVATRHIIPTSERKRSGRGFQKAPEGYSTFSRTWKNKE